VALQAGDDAGVSASVRADGSTNRRPSRMAVVTTCGDGVAGGFVGVAGPSGQGDVMITW
jgi:hypothetical protein